jgi:hypothetical protein
VSGTFNGSRRLTSPEGDLKGYVFTVFTTAGAPSPFSDGWVYLVERDTFEVSMDSEGTASDEWLSAVPVKPVARLQVSPGDFPHLDHVVVRSSDGYPGP